jgi:hypothetical protein
MKTDFLANLKANSDNVSHVDRGIGDHFKKIGEG